MNKYINVRVSACVPQNERSYIKKMHNGSKLIWQHEMVKTTGFEASEWFSENKKQYII